MKSLVYHGPQALCSGGELTCTGLRCGAGHRGTSSDESEILGVPRPAGFVQHFNHHQLPAYRSGISWRLHSGLSSEGDDNLDVAPVCDREQASPKRLFPRWLSENLRCITARRLCVDRGEGIPLEELPTGRALRLPRVDRTAGLSGFNMSATHWMALVIF